MLSDLRQPLGAWTLTKHVKGERGGKKPRRTIGQARTAATQRRILKAALTEFARKGFAGASVREIARKAGLGDGLVHYHFGSKEMLWRAVAKDLFDDLHAKIETEDAQAQTLDELGKVRLRARNLIGYHLEHPELQAFVGQEFERRSPRLTYIIETFINVRLPAALAGILKSQKLGELPNGDPHLLYIIITTLAQALSRHAGEIEELTGRSIRDETLQAEYWNLVDELIFAPRHRKLVNSES
jgi:TetR/AcrR family transcriptional regulator